MSPKLVHENIADSIKENLDWHIQCRSNLDFYRRACKILLLLYNFLLDMFSMTILSYPCTLYYSGTCLRNRLT